MKPHVTVILLTIAAVLTVFVVGFERHLDSSREVEASSRLLIPLEVDALKRIRIRNAVGEVSIDRKDYGWKLMSPVDDHADPESIAKLADRLAHLAIRETIRREELGADGIRLSQLGLSESQAIEVKLEFDDGRESVTFHFGAAAALQGTLYARMPRSAARQDVYVVDGDFRDWIADPGATLRDRRLFRLHPGEIQSYRITTENGVIELEREPDAPRWFVQQPLKARANDDIAYSILDDLSKLKIIEFLDPRAAATTGLSGGIGPNSAVFALQPQGGKPFTVKLREESAQKGTLLATISGRDAIFRIKNDLVSRLPKTINQVRYPYLADVNSPAVARIEIESPLDTVDLRRLPENPQEWRLIRGSQNFRANKDKIDRLLGALNSENIVDYRSDSASQLEEFGLHRPLASISVTTSSVDAAALEGYRAKVAEAQQAGKDPDKVPKPKIEVTRRTLRFGRNDDLFLNAKFDDEPFVYAIDPAFLSINVPTHPLDWRGLDLIGFDLYSVREIAIAEVAAPPLRLFYDYLHGKWTGILGEHRIDDAIESRMAERLAAHLGSLRARQWLTQSRHEAYRALSSPSLQVRIKLQKPSVGNAEPNPVGFAAFKLAPATISGTRVVNYFGQFEGHPDVFLLDAVNYDRIVAPVWRQKASDKE